LPSKHESGGLANSFRLWLPQFFGGRWPALIRAIGIDANSSVVYGNLAFCLVNLDQMDAARKVVDEAFSRKLDDFFVRQARYTLAFLQGDELEMQKQLAWSAGRPREEEAIFLAYQADREAVHGHPSKSHEYSRRAVDSELRAN
jgi:hypothetical protein